MLEKIICPICGHITEQYKNPKPTADVIVEINGKILLIKRKNPPYGWAIPGGFIDYGESAEDAALLEIKEETGIELSRITQFRCYSAPDRDPRSHTITVVFIAQSQEQPIAGDDALETGLFEQDNLPSPIVFDHAEILRDYLVSRTSKKADIKL
ncbi:MAG: NUDIX hydrolase [Candidatus Latescibacteria bacterium]|nr:NUDIX hydrolase [Candidatus Latescibacterota bacterium]